MYLGHQFRNNFADGINFEAPHVNDCFTGQSYCNLCCYYERVYYAVYGVNRKVHVEKNQVVFRDGHSVVYTDIDILPDVKYCLPAYIGTHFDT